MRVDRDGQTRGTRLAARAAAAACVALAALAVVTTSPSVSQTIDEATHVAAGLEWLDAGSYRLHPETPPLARVLLASGPFLAGARAVASLEDRNAVLASGDAQLPRLWYARLGNLLPLFALAALVFCFAARSHDEATALIAVLLLVSLPVLLAHAGLATTDLSLAATHTAALLALLRWLERPDHTRGAVLGLALALALLCKFSALPFLAASFAVTLVTRRVCTGAAGAHPSRAGASLGAGLALALLVIWAGYRFSIGPVWDGPPIPAPELVRGLRDLHAHGQQGHLAYLLGETRTGGWWYFFPVAIAVKTPIPFLALVVLGAAALFTDAGSRTAWQRLVPLLGAAGLLLATFPSRIDIGLRHLLPIFPLLAIVAAGGAMMLYRATRLRVACRTALVLLLIWQLAGAAVAHPAYLAYFNVLAGDRPEEILVDSDLDWGQDVDRLFEELQLRGIEEVSLLLFTTMGVPRERLPERTHILKAGERATGWEEALKAVPRIDLLLAAGLCLLALGVYVSTVAPGLVFADAGELALVAATDGVAHPPGFPLYLLLAKLWLALPLGSDVAWRLNLLSAVLGALTLPVVYLGVRLITADPGRAAWISRVGSASAALLFGFSYTFWRQATITEVYTLNLLMASLVLALSIRYFRHAEREAPRKGHAACIGLVAGLGVANHLSLGLMLFGVAVLVVIAPRRDPRSLARDVAAGLGCFGAGLLLYALLPLRAAAEPILAWGDPRDLGSLWRHVTGWQYQLNFQPTAATLAKQLEAFGGTALREVGLLPLLLLPVGLAKLGRAHRALLVAFAIAFLVPLAYLLGYDIAEDQATYFLIPFLLGAMLMGVAVDALLRSPRLRGREVWVAAALLLLALSPLAHNYARADRSLETEARAYALDVLDAVARDAVVLTRFWNLYSPVLYLQHLESLRRDVDFVDLSLLQYTWYVDYLLRQEPGLFTGQEARLARYRDLHARWERDTRSLSRDERAEAERLFAELVDDIVREAWRKGRPVYATFESVVDIERRFRVDPAQDFLAVPETLPMRLLPRRHPYLHPLPGVSFRNRWMRESSDEVAAFVKNRYVEFWLQRGRYFETRQLWEAASHAYRSADAISPGSDTARRALRRIPARERRGTAPQAER